MRLVQLVVVAAVAAGEGFQDCPANHVFPFEGIAGGDGWVVDGAGGVDAGFRASGTASLRLGDPAAPDQQATARFRVPAASKPRLLTFALAWLGARPSLVFRDAAGATCFGVSRQKDGTLALGSTSSVVIEKRVFYQVELRPDWARRRTFLTIDGVVEAVSFPFESPCEGGVHQVVLFGNAWLDDFSFLCHSYLLATGSLQAAGGGAERLLRKGGGVLVVEWVTPDNQGPFPASQDGKEDLLSALTADNPSAAGWQALRRVLLPGTGSVAVTEAGKRVTFGPLAAAPQYSVPAQDGVSFRWGGARAGFTVPGSCAQTTDMRFDGSLPLLRPLPDGYSVRDGRLVFPANASVLSYDVSRASRRPERIAFRARLPENAVQTEFLSLEFHDSTSGEHLALFFGIHGAVSVVTEFGRLHNIGSITRGVWHTVEWTFDWQRGTATFGLDGVFGEPVDLPRAFRGVGLLGAFSFSAAEMEWLVFSCPPRPPVASFTPACPDPAADTDVSFAAHPGTQPLTSTARFALVPEPSPCSLACTGVGLCFDGTAAVSNGGRLLWDVPASSLSPAAAYRICYRRAAAWEPLPQTLLTCGSTAAPFTAPPLTGAPSTGIPATQPPLTESPSTAAPATGAPPTLPPVTPSPATAAPATTSPPTRPPLTVVPATPMPLAVALRTLLLFLRGFLTLWRLLQALAKCERMLQQVLLARYVKCTVVCSLVSGRCYSIRGVLLLEEEGEEEGDEWRLSFDVEADADEDIAALVTNAAPIVAHSIDKNMSLERVSVADVRAPPSAAPAAFLSSPIFIAVAGFLFLFACFCAAVRLLRVRTRPDTRKPSLPYGEEDDATTSPREPAKPSDP